jgi:hypothetical protein
VLNCTWDDMEHEMALRKLGDHLDEQQKAERYYLKLREEFRKMSQIPVDKSKDDKPE